MASTLLFGALAHRYGVESSIMAGAAMKLSALGGGLLTGVGP